jgi:hypothetical protein
MNRVVRDQTSAIDIALARCASSLCGQTRSWLRCQPSARISPSAATRRDLSQVIIVGRYDERLASLRASLVCVLLDRDVIGVSASW